MSLIYVGKVGAREGAYGQGVEYKLYLSELNCVELVGELCPTRKFPDGRFEPNGESIIIDAACMKAVGELLIDGFKKSRRIWPEWTEECVPYEPDGPKCTPSEDDELPI